MLKTVDILQIEIVKDGKLVAKIKDANGKEVKLYGVLVASACGTVDEPWNKYDIVCYFN